MITFYECIVCGEKKTAEVKRLDSNVGLPQYCGAACEQNKETVRDEEAIAYNKITVSEILKELRTEYRMRDIVYGKKVFRGEMTEWDMRTKMAAIEKARDIIEAAFARAPVEQASFFDVGNESA